MDQYHQVVNVYQMVGTVRRLVCTAYMLMGSTPIPGSALLGLKEFILQRGEQTRTYKGIILTKDTPEMEPFLWPITDIEGTCPEGIEMVNLLTNQFRSSTEVMVYPSSEDTPPPKKRQRMSNVSN